MLNTACRGNLDLFNPDCALALYYKLQLLQTQTFA